MQSVRDRIEKLAVHGTSAEIQVVIDPLAKGVPTVIKKNEIEERRVSPMSIMPNGLLDKLSREEILDLIAFVYARGDKNNPLFADHDQHHH